MSILNRLRQKENPTWYLQDKDRYLKMYREEYSKDLVYAEFPQTEDKTQTTDFDPHYTYQGPWVMRKLLKRKPEKHIDIGSWTAYLGFFASLQPTEFVDIRPADLEIPKLRVKSGSILSLPYQDASQRSVSCLHVVEHIGLGRYGDELDPLGTLKALSELERILAVKGDLYLSLPVGREVTYFNAHRVTHPANVIKAFQSSTLQSLSAIMDDGTYVEKAEKTSLATQDYACGLFHFRKSKA